MKKIKNVATQVILSVEHPLKYMLNKNHQLLVAIKSSCSKRVRPCEILIIWFGY